MDVYAKYKTKLSCPDVEEHTVWKEIADELQKLINIKCDELDCCSKIDELRCEYEKMKNKCIPNLKTAMFLDKASQAFETIENPGKFKFQKILMLFQFYFIKI